MLFRRRVGPFFCTVALALALALPCLARAAEQSVATVQSTFGEIRWTFDVDVTSSVLSIEDPTGFVETFQFGPGAQPVYPLQRDGGDARADGAYTWELRLQKSIPIALERSMAAAKKRQDEEAVQRLQRSFAPIVESGTFTVAGGFVNSPAVGASDDGGATPRRSVSNLSAKDQIVPDDLIVDGKGCIGLACVLNEAFQSETLRLKQSVVRLRFEDTSSAANFPARDWQLTANDSVQFGADKFSLDDLTAGTTPMTVRGGAPSSSLYVDAVGKVGLGTSTPAQNLHVAAGTSPTLRFEQTGAPARTWDVAAGSTAFQVKDVTNASAVPFQIQPGTPANTLVVESHGRVGIGTAVPDRELEVIQTVDPPERGIITSIFTGEGTAPSNAALMSFKKARGTRSAPQIVASGDNVGFLRPYAYDGSSYLTTAFLGFKVDGTPASGSMPVAYVIGTGSIPFGTERMRVTSAGSVGIGTSAPSSLLHVSGGDVRVTGGSFIDDGVTLNAPDYVFDPGYRLVPLPELADYIAREHHLPDTPSASEIKRDGLKLGEFQMRLLEKVEELTLYLVQQNREIASLKDQNEAQGRTLTGQQGLLAEQAALIDELRRRVEVHEASN